MQAAFPFYLPTPMRPARPERLFYALFPDAATSLRTQRYLKRFLHDYDLEGTALDPERLHVSLHHIGDFKHLPTKILYAARLAASVVEVAPFEISFSIIQTFDGAPHNLPL